MRKVEKDRDILGQDPPLIEFQGGDIAFGVDRPKVSTVLCAMGRKIYPHQVQRNAFFFGNDMSGHGTGAGGIVEFHPVLHEEDGESRFNQ